MVKIQTYEPQDMVVEKNYRKGLWKGEKLWSLYKRHALIGIKMLNLAKRKKISLLVLRLV